MKSSFFLTLLSIACLLFSASAYILEDATYYAAGPIMPNYLDGTTTNNARGIYYFEYAAGTKTLNYRVITTLKKLGTVTLNGPTSCQWWNQAAPACYFNTGPKVFTLGKGAAPASEGEDDTDSGNQMISGTVVFDAIQENMFFNGEFYILVNTLVLGEDDKTYIDKASMRGIVYVFDNSMQQFLTSYMVFEANKGSFSNDPDSISSSTNQGIGYVTINPGATTNQGSLYLFTTIKQPGKYFLNCGDLKPKLLFSSDNTGGQNPTALFGVNINFAADNAQEQLLRTEFLLQGNCYIFISSAEYPNGDLFTWLKPMNQYKTISLGANYDPPVSSAYYAYHVIDFDYATKLFKILTMTNLTTSTITKYQLIYVDKEDDKEKDVVLCNLGTVANTFVYYSSTCQINSTYIGALENGTLYVEITAGSKIRGSIGGGTSSGSNSLAIGLGVGLGVGIPVAAAAGVGAFFAVKKYGKGMSNRGKI